MIFHIVLLVLYITAINSSIISDARDSLISYLSNYVNYGDNVPHQNIQYRSYQEQPTDKSTFDIHTEDAGKDPIIIKIFRSRDDNDVTGNGGDEKIQNLLLSGNTMARHDQAEERYGLDETDSIRRQRKRSRRISELAEWLKELTETINQTIPKAEPLSMVTLTPLGVSCGGKKYNQPLGSCKLTGKCDPEYRINSGGDCGSTTFVCCLLRIDNIDDEELIAIGDEATGSKEERIVKQKRINLKERTSQKNVYDQLNLKQMNGAVRRDEGPIHPALSNFRRDTRRLKKSEMVPPQWVPPDSSSSSKELKDWKLDWKESWMQKKMEAINSTEPKGDVVNMVAARPWGVPCGDPKQHDMPWGTCTLAPECEAEFRIFRGDYLCGRTQFVCCAVQHAVYDLNQAFDASLYDSGLTTDSEERRNKGKGASQLKREQKARDRRRRKKLRNLRKKRIKKSIEKMVKTMKKLLNRQYNNMSISKKIKTKQLKNFIKDLKKKYKQDRTVAKSVNEIGLLKIDAGLMKLLVQIKDLNSNFIKNSTFRQVIADGTMTKNTGRMLVEAYPELEPFMNDYTRRSGNARSPKDYLDYDVDYGMLHV